MTHWSGRSTWSRTLLSRDLVPLGDFVFPRKVEWRFEGENGDPNLKASFEYREGRPQCVAVEVTASPDGRAVRTADLAVLEVDKMTVTAFTQFAMHSTFDPERNSTELTPVDLDNEREFWAVINGVETAVKAPRRGVTQAELERVADIYRRDADRDPTRAVEIELGYGSRRTAERRLKQAEQAGLLPSTTPGKKRVG